MSAMEDRDLTRRILSDSIQRASTRPLRDEVLQRAVDVAETVWNGHTPCGAAVDAGLAAVEQAIYKPK